MACTRGALEQIPRHQERNTRHQFTNMLDKLPVELLKLVGDAICPSSQIKNDVVIHGAVLDASAHLVLNWDPQRANLEARQTLAHARVVCRFLRKELPPPRLKLRNVIGPGAGEGHIAQSGTNTWIPEDVLFPQAAGHSVVFRYEVRVEGQAEVIGGLSRTRARFGTGNEDALTWYLAPHRHDFRFRTRMFNDFTGSMIRNNTQLVPGRWHLIMVVISKVTSMSIPAVKAKYYLDADQVAMHLLQYGATSWDTLTQWTARCPASSSA